MKGKLLLECSVATRKHKCHSFGSMSELFPVGAPLGTLMQEDKSEKHESAGASLFGQSSGS